MTAVAVAPVREEVVDPSRHLRYFDPFVFDNTRVDVVGCGAVGSRLAMELAKLGVRNLHLWDGDTVEKHNIGNQQFGLPDVGRLKVEALTERISVDTGIRPTSHPQFVESRVPFGKVVFLAVDTMAARRTIFKQALHLQFGTELVVETRMGAEELRVYGFNPRRRDEVNAWESTLCDDRVTVESACGTQSTVGATAGITAYVAVHRFLQWYRREVARDNTSSNIPPFEQVMMLRPLFTTTS